MKHTSALAVLDALPVPPDPFAQTLVEQVVRRQDQADALIEEAAVGWPLDRLAVVDHLLLRLGVAELMDPDGPDTGVILDEAVELAKTYSTDESGKFVNGVLSTLARKIRSADGGRAAGSSADGDSGTDL